MYLIFIPKLTLSIYTCPFDVGYATGWNVGCDKTNPAMPLNYELESLDELISNTLHPTKLLIEQSISDQQFDNWNKLLFEEKELIRKQLKKTTFGFTKEAHRRLYIQQHQSSIISLKNQLVDFLMPMDASVLAERSDDANLARIYKRCLITLDELMEFIRDEFWCYFNEAQMIPANKLLQIQGQFEIRMPKVSRSLIQSGQDALLISHVFETIMRHLNTDSAPEVTYRKYQYLKILMTSLENMNGDSLPICHYPSLPALLIHLNFNATIFKNYMVKLLHEEINACTSIEEKIETISFHHKELSQMTVKPGMALSTSFPSVQMDLVTWLFNEMTHLEKKQTLGIVAPIHFKESIEQDTEKGIYSSLTVEELALFVKVQKDTGVLKNKNMKQVARTIAKDWHSKQKDNISWQYLYNSMSKVDVGTINSLDSKLMDMVNMLRKMRGGIK